MWADSPAYVGRGSAFLLARAHGSPTETHLTESKPAALLSRIETRAGKVLARGGER